MSSTKRQERSPWEAFTEELEIEVRLDVEKHGSARRVPLPESELLYGFTGAGRWERSIARKVVTEAALHVLEEEGLTAPAEPTTRQGRLMLARPHLEERLAQRIARNAQFVLDHYVGAPGSERLVEMLTKLRAAAMTSPAHRQPGLAA